MKQQLFARVAALALLTGSASLYADSVKVTDLPQNVRKSVIAQAGGGKIGDVERTIENGRTVYRVEIKRDGANKHVYVSDGGAVLRTSNAAVATAKANTDTHVEVRSDRDGALSKTDGKILGIIPAPGRDKDAEVKIKAGDNELKAEADFDGEQKQIRTQTDREADRLKVRNEAGVNIERDRNLTSKTDGKILGIPIPGKTTGADASVKVDVDRDRDLTAKNDGRILGVPKPNASARADVNIDTDGPNKSARVDVDTDLDKDRNLTSKNDGRILGVPIPDGKKNSASVNADVDVNKGASARVDVDTDNDIIRKNDGKILGIKKPDGSARADVDVDTDGKSARVDVDADNGILQKNDGKILGIPKPNGRKNTANSGVRVDADVDQGASASVDVDVDRDRDLTAKNDGRILGVPKPQANTRVQADTNVDLENGEAKVEVKKKRSIFGKGDGKILGIFSTPGAKKSKSIGGSASVETNKDRVQADVKGEPQNRVTTDADGGLDTDKEDGRILGVPKRGFENLNINQVPAPVRRAIQRESGGGKVVEIELANDKGQSVYEVDIERDGANREIKITPDGTVLSPERK